jgi:tetratricopeptide (TPR) repeat protein
MPRQLLQLAALIAIIFAAYFPTLHNGFIWDDDRYIEQNMQLRTLHGLQHIWLWPLTAEPQYYPLTHTTLWVEYHLWGLRATGYHVDNVLIHAASAVLLWRILRKLGMRGAWVVAAIWAVHPLQVESVAWATERKNVLSGLFYFMALGSYLRTEWGRRLCEAFGDSNLLPSPPPECHGRGEGQSPRKKQARNWAWYAASLLLFICAILSKSVASTLPAVILLLCWWKRGRILRSDVWPVVPMFGMGLAMGTLTGWMEKHVVGAMGKDFDLLTRLDRVCIAGRAFWFYLQKLLWPGTLAFIYPKWNVNPGERLWWILFSAAATGVLIAPWLLRNRIGRGPATAAFFFAGTLVPALGFVNVFPMRYSYVADHFQYLACIGPIALAVELLQRNKWPALRCGLGAVVVGSLCVATSFRTHVFFDRLTLWKETLATNPQSAMVHNNYAAALRDSGEISAAKAQFEEALRLGGDATDWVGLGQCCAIEGDYLKARDMYLKALEAAPVSDEAVFRHFRAGQEFQLGTAYQGLAREFSQRSVEYLAEAQEAYQRAIYLFPEYGDARKNLAIMLMDQKKYSQAIEQCRKMTEFDPDSVSARTNMGTIYYQEGDLGAALAQYQSALELEPDNAGVMASVGAILAQEGKINDAIEILNRAVRIDPKNQIARQNLAAAMARRDRGN